MANFSLLRQYSATQPAQGTFVNPNQSILAQQQIRAQREGALLQTVGDKLATVKLDKTAGGQYRSGNFNQQYYNPVLGTKGVSSRGSGAVNETADLVRVGTKLVPRKQAEQMEIAKNMAIFARKGQIRQYQQQLSMINKDQGKKFSQYALQQANDIFKNRLVIRTQQQAPEVKPEEPSNAR